MPDRVVFHVLPRNGFGWVVRRENGSPVSLHDRRDEALYRARDLVLANQRGKVLLFNRDGAIVREYTYGEATEVGWQSASP